MGRQAKKHMTESRRRSTHNVVRCALIAGTVLTSALVLAPAGVSGFAPRGSSVELFYFQDPRAGSYIDIEGTDQPDEIVVTGSSESVTVRASAPIVLAGDADQACEVEPATLAECEFDGPYETLEFVSMSGRAGGDDLLDETSLGGARLFGDEGRDRLRGGDGFDDMEGGSGADRLAGGDGRDFLSGGSGKDRLGGGGRRDMLAGEKGRDVLRGGSGGDALGPDPGRDEFRAGRGNDHIEARSRDRDELIFCGPGKADEARLDGIDPRPRRCETIL